MSVLAGKAREVSNEAKGASRPAKNRRPLTPYLALIFVGSAVWLSVLAAGLLAERRRLEEKSDGEARAAVAKMAEDFDHHFDQLAEDTRLLAELIWQAERDPLYPRAAAGKVLSAGVRSLASAVHHCRGLSFSRDGKLFEIELAAGEDPTLGSWLESEGGKAFAMGTGGMRLSGPRRIGERPFFAHAQTLPFGVVVAAVDARLLFETLQHGRPAGARFVVVDGAETMWVGCGSVSTCMGMTREEWQNDESLRKFLASRSGEVAGTNIPAGLRRILSLSPNLDMAVYWQAMRTGDAMLSLGLITSLSELQSRRQAAWWRLSALSAALCLSVAIVGMFLWRLRVREGAMAERLRHAEEMNRMEHQLVRAEKLATVGVLTAGLAHEVGTPLAIIRGRAEILGEKTDRPEAKTILDQSDRIAGTLRQVLDFSREQPVACQLVGVAPAFQAVADLLGFRLRRKGITLIIPPLPDGLSLAADPDQLQQVLVNLVMNAMDACAPGGEVTLSAWASSTSPGFLRMTVADSGRGIPPDQLDAVFDPFFTTKPKGEGTGLGLPVVASITRNHRGHISLSSAFGKGTTVTLLWPTECGDAP